FDVQQLQQYVLYLDIVMPLLQATLGGQFHGATTRGIEFADQGLEIDAHLPFSFWIRLRAVSGLPSQLFQPSLTGAWRTKPAGGASPWASSKTRVQPRSGPK